MQRSCRARPSRDFSERFQMIRRSRLKTPVAATCCRDMTCGSAVDGKRMLIGASNPPLPPRRATVSRPKGCKFSQYGLAIRPAMRGRRVRRTGCTESAQTLERAGFASHSARTGRRLRRSRHDVRFYAPPRAERVAQIVAASQVPAANQTPTGVDVQGAKPCWS